MKTDPKSDPHTDDRYYKHAGKLSLARHLSALARRRVYDYFIEVMHPGPEDIILDVGVTDDIGRESNMLEQMYPYRKNLTCAGLTDGSAIERAYPGITHVRIKAGQPLPFKSDAFSIVYCNAVLEHVGDTDSQRRFLAELCRMAARRFVVVPNRWFPVEHHTGLPLLHYLPKRVFRSLLRGTRYDVWSYEENSNCVSKHELKQLWPTGEPVEVKRRGIGIGLCRSNLIAWQGTQGSRP